MAEAEAPEEAPPKKSKKPLIFGVLLALILGGGGFYATYAGLILGDSHEAEAQETSAEPLPEIAFVPVEPLVINLGPAENGKHLRFAAQIEVSLTYQPDVTLLLPRISDVMNGYLRAVDPVSFDDPATMPRIRAHLLRRIQLVTGEGRVRDLLITEFVMN